MDDYACGKAAVDYLLKRGHKSIAGIFKSDDSQGHLRYAGYASELTKHKMPLQEENIIWFTTEDMDLDDDSALAFEQRLHRRLQGCTAIICYNDQVALRVMEAMEHNDMCIPDDMSIISFDDSYLATMGKVGLTTFEHPKEELGSVAAENLLKLLRREHCDAAVKFKPKLIERDSVKDLTKK
jgi:GntR family transcriptional regulator of arabinose operon